MESDIDASILKLSDGGTAKYTSSQFESVFQFFEVTARKHPLAPAIEEANGAITNYETLLAQVNLLSSWIHLKTENSSRFVAVLIPNGKDYIITVAALLKCGKTFVPLDPTHPVQRIRTILEDLNLPVLITTLGQEEIVNALSYTEENTILLDDRPEEQGLLLPPNVKYDGEDAMYCTFTSGSTGVPKGVVITHLSVLNWIGWMIDEFKITSADRSLAWSNPTFDMSIAQVWVFLCSGAAVVIPPASSMGQLHAFVDERKISIMYLSTVPAETFFEQTHLNHLRWLLFGGEVLRCSTSMRLSPKLPFGLCHCYGSTETTISMTFQKFYPGDLVTLSVGRPIPNHQIYIMDDHQALLKAGDIGEIYIGGIGVSPEGYYKRPKENAKVFVLTPFGRLCRIGDLGFWRDDGTLEIRGRTDSLVKVRGYRVELGDVEANLMTHPAVKLAAVRRDSALDSLYAYTILHTSTDENEHVYTEEDIKAYLEEKLPGYAVPSRILELQEFPLTSNDKIDKKKLIQMVREESPDKEIAEDLSLETKLIHLWSQLLKVPVNKLSLKSNFFEHGGHSRLGVELVCQIRKMLNRPHILSFVSVYYHPTIKELRNAIELALDKTPIDLPVPNLNEPQEAPFPLSYAQEQIWMHLTENASTTVWNIVRLIRFKTPVSSVHLEKSLQKIVDKYSSFRTTVFSVDGQAWQKIKTEQTINLDLLDVGVELMDAIRNLRNDYLYDIKTGPLYSFALLDEQHLAVCYHHLIMDGHGWALFLKELDNEISGKFSSLALPDSALKDAVLWERSQTFSPESIQYWESQLNDFRPVTLPQTAIDEHPPGNRILNLNLSPELAEELRALASQEQTTLFTLMLSIFNVLLYRHTHESDQTLLTLFRSGQSHEGTESMIANFVNLIPVRTNIETHSSFQTYLAQSKARLAECLKNGGIPYQHMLGLSKTDRQLKNQLLKTMFQMRPPMDGELTELEEVWLEEYGVSQVDLGIDICDIGSRGLICSMDFNPSVFSSNYIQRLLKQYERLARSILNSYVEAGPLSIDRLQILPEEERNTIMNEFSSTSAAVIPEMGLLQSFETQAKKFPAELCVKEYTSSMTYNDVQGMSNLVAKHVEKNLRSEDEFVAILLPRSDQFIVSTLAVLKTGKAIAPLSTTHPGISLVAMLNDLGNPVLITNRANASTVTRLYTRLLILEDLDDKDLPENISFDFEARSSDPPEIMYCMFTSGTTGIPKGVLVKHSAVLNIVSIYTNLMNLSENDRSLAFHNSGFDASLIDFWPALITGGSIWIPDEDLSYDPEMLFNYIQKNEITFANLPTVMAEKMFSHYAELEGVSPLHLRWLTFGAEQLKALPPKNFPATCLNAYGPTETTIDATQVIVRHDTKRLDVLGRPISNGNVYILDEEMQPVPIGVEGMLWIGGCGIAKGYLRKPELTAQVFVQSPFEPNEKIYCSGDVARWLEDGTISLIGRRDGQVKVNGFRIELTGIEAALQAHPSVQQAVVVYRNENDSTKHLEAFCIHNSNQKTAAVEDIQTFIKNRLPYYSVPKRIHWVKLIPITSNGKVDRKSLLQGIVKETVAAEVHEVLRQPLTKQEKELGKIWSKILNIKRLDLTKDSNFFEVGGNSIQIGQLLREISRSETLSIFTQDIFTNPTLSAMSHIVEAKRTEAAARKSEVALSNYQRLVWYRQHFQLGEDSTIFNRHRIFQFYTEQVKKPVESKLHDVLQKYESNLCLHLQFCQGDILTSRSSFDKLKIQQFSEGNLEAHVESELAKPFDLVNENQLLFKVSIWRNPEGQFKHLCFFWHHILLSPDIESALFLDIMRQLHVAPIPDSRRQERLQKPTTISELLDLLNVDKKKATVLVQKEKLTRILTNYETKLNTDRIFEYCQEDQDLFKSLTLNGGKRLVVLRLPDSRKSRGPTAIVWENEQLEAGDIEINVGHHDAKVELGCKYFNNAGPSTKAKQYWMNSTPESSTWSNIISRLWSLIIAIPQNRIFGYPDYNFFELGGTSAQLLQAASWLRTLHGNRHIPLTHFFKHFSLAMLSNSFPYQPVPGPHTSIENILEHDVTEIAKELSLFGSLLPYEIKEMDNCVFLTGSTGYLGAFILEALLKDTEICKIYCLVRGNVQRLTEILQQYGILQNGEALPSKVIPVQGELGPTNFGMSPDDYKLICREVDIICHCGAQVNFIHSYAQLRSANVLGTKSVCSFALTGKRKALHYISTTDAAVGQFLFEKEIQVDEDVIGPPPYWETGYYQTKWISECLVQHMAQFVPAKIYRVGTVGVHSNRPVFNSTSFDGIFIRAAAQLGAYPVLPGFTVPYSDVDYCAAAIQELITLDPRRPSPFIQNIVQQNYLQTEIFEGMELSAIPVEEWYQRFTSMYENNADDEKMQSLQLLLEQRPWGQIGKLRNMIEALAETPPMSYDSALGADMVAGFMLKQPQIRKYIQMHCE